MYKTDYKYFGRMNAPDAAAREKGVCADEIEFYLTITDDTIVDIRFYTEGCEHTKICGETTAELAAGKKIDDVLTISPAQIRAEINELPDDHVHCTVLTAITLLKAVAEYLHLRNNT